MTIIIKICVHQIEYKENPIINSEVYHFRPENKILVYLSF